MADSDRHGEPAPLTRLERISARLHGQADGSRWLKHGGTREALSVAENVRLWTPYIGVVQQQAARASNLLVRRMRQRNAGLLRVLTANALRVNQEHELHGELRPSTSGRFVESVTAWKGEYADYRRLAEASVSYFNQMINYYWIYFLRAAGHPVPVSRSRGPLPELADIDPIWAKQDPLALLVDDETDEVAATGAERIIRKAQEIVEGRA